MIDYSEHVEHFTYEYVHADLLDTGRKLNLHKPCRRQLRMYVQISVLRESGYLLDREILYFFRLPEILFNPLMRNVPKWSYTL